MIGPACFLFTEASNHYRQVRLQKSRGIRSGEGDPGALDFHTLD